MPRGDRTGPMGQGPRTGRAAGYCAGNDRPGSAQAGPGMGFGRGGWAGRRWGMQFGRPRGRTRGFGGWWGGPGAWNADPWGPPTAPEVEMADLTDQANWLQEQLDAVRARINELGLDKAEA